MKADFPPMSITCVAPTMITSIAFLSRMAKAVLLLLAISTIPQSSSNVTLGSSSDMVKTTDEESLPDHIGWRLWQANRAWLKAFAEAMRASGHDWFTESRAGLMGLIPRTGIRQSA